MSAPTVVLVHGTFADASSWNGVIERLQAKGITMVSQPQAVADVILEAVAAVGS